MDLQTRKLNLIAFLAQLQDEILVNKLENFLKKNFKDESIELKTFTKEEFLGRINKSEEDLLNGKFKTQEELEKMSANW